MQRDPGLPSLDEVCAFLDKKARSLTHGNSGHEQRAGIKRKATTGPSKSMVPSREATRNDRVRANDSHNRSNRVTVCYHCKADHTLARCPEFLALNMAGRREAIKKMKRCPNCLQEGHEVPKCTAKGCIQCPNNPKHMFLLCPTRGYKVGMLVAEPSEQTVKRLKAARQQADRSE